MHLNSMMEMVKSFLFALLGVFALTILVYAQDQSGFISIDCGILNSNYTDEKTGINYMSDVTYIDTGISMSISSKFSTSNLTQQLLNVRSFPEGMKSCYVLAPPNPINATYFIRASFFYGDYDGQGQLPEFDLHLGVNKWDSVSFFDSSTVVTKEIIHVLSSKIIYVCLINTGSGTPFISSLELRPLMDTIYEIESGSLLLFKRLNFGSATNDLVRYNDDVYDRIWEPIYTNKENRINSTQAISNNLYEVPVIVLGTAITSLNPDNALEFYWNFGSSSSRFYMYMHFAELQQLQANKSRVIDIFVNGEIWYSNHTLDYLSVTTIYSPSPEIKEWLNISIKSLDSALPPIINALEIYTMKEFLQPQTDEDDAYAMMNIKSSYRVKRNWQGDPCAPNTYVWTGLKCNYNASVQPRVISLDLSSIGLIGEISPYIFNLTLIQYLDLSNNNLTGRVPDFLSQLPFLRVIKLTHNKFTGPLPEKLLEKSKNGSLSLRKLLGFLNFFTFVAANFIDASVDDDNSNLCSSVPCKKKKNKNNNVAVIASVAASFIVLIALTTVWGYNRISRKKKAIKFSMKTKLKGRILDTTKRRFTYSEVLIITNKLETVIGKGGFGPVYHGYLEDTEVAVKMLSSSSIQGYKEFSAEIDFLTRVHHINLTSLVGYCDEGDNVGLIYEYMANGNLREHLSDRHPTVLSWGERLQIALDAATGLEYLHTSCKPPIIHRDVKSANILLNEKFRAKLADFGLSKDFPVDNTHVSTAIAGTPGYLDPEYYISYKLTEKSDIFSFGIVLLEIITSRPVITRDQDNAHISQWVSSRLAREEDLRSIVDARLGIDFEVNSIQKAIEIAMACASPTSIQRPTMNHVVMELNQCLATEMARKNEGNGTELEDSSVGTSLNFITQSSFGAR